MESRDGVGTGKVEYIETLHDGRKLPPAICIFKEEIVGEIIALDEVITLSS